MESLNFNYQIEPFEKTIQLYGDRAGGQGNFDFAGLAALQTTKFVLVIGNPHSLEQPSDWRRFLRLLQLAQRLHKPVLFWNLPFTQNTSAEVARSLELGTAIKTTKMRLLRLPQPIIAVYDERFDFDATVQTMSWGDGIIVVKPEKRESISVLNSELPKLKIVYEQSEIQIQVLNLLKEVSMMNSEELVTNRLASFSIPSEIQS